MGKEYKILRRIKVGLRHSSLMRHKIWAAKLYKEGWLGANGFGERFINTHIL